MLEFLKNIWNWIKAHPWWTTFIVVCLGVIIWIIVAYFISSYPFNSDDDSLSKKAGVKFQGKLTAESRAHLKLEQKEEPTVAEACTVPTDEEAQKYRLDPSRELICSQEMDHIELLQFRGFDVNLGKYFYTQPGKSDLVVDLINVSGTYYSLYLTLVEDYLSKGFNGGDQSGEFDLDEIKASIAAMGTLHFDQFDATKTAILQGTNSPTPCTGTTGREGLDTFTFDVANPTTTSLNPTLDFSQLVEQTISGESLAGCLRVSAKFVDYTVKVTDTFTAVIRVYLSDCEGRMGDKALVVNGVPQWYDYEQKSMVTTRTDKVLSFWNQRFVQDQLGLIPSDQKGEDEVITESGDDPTQEDFIGAFRQHLIGMPITVTNSFTTTDLKALAAKTKTLNLTIGNSPKVLFRDIKSHPAVVAGGDAIELLQSKPELQLLYYDMPDLSLTANLEFIDVVV